MASACNAKASVGEPSDVPPVAAKRRPSPPVPRTLAALDHSTVPTLARPSGSGRLSGTPTPAFGGLPSTVGTENGFAASCVGSTFSTAICSTSDTTSVGGAPTSMFAISALPTDSTPLTRAPATSVPAVPPLVASIMLLSASTATDAVSSVTLLSELSSSFTASIVTGGTLGGGLAGGGNGGGGGDVGCSLDTLMLPIK